MVVELATENANHFTFEHPIHYVLAAKIFFYKREFLEH